jgi:predicted glycogen debranching enzyme
MREHGAMVQRVLLRPNEVEVQPMAHLPPIIFGHRGVFVGSPDWWRRFEYPKDREMDEEFVEDMWTPGAFEIRLEPGRTEYLVAGVGELPDGQPSDLISATVEHELLQDPGPGRPRSVRALSVAAEAFCAHRAARPAIIAGYPSLDSITRDALQSLPGLYLARGRVAEAKVVLRALLGRRRRGLLPFRLESGEAGSLPPCPDATLWLFEVARELVERVGPSDEFVRTELYPALCRAFVSLAKGKQYGVWLTSDGLLANGFEGLALTWMDARNGDQFVTPRRGLAIELQALWSRGCETLGDLARNYQHRGIFRAAHTASHRAREAFRERFWCNETEYPFDCLSEQRDSADTWADASVRPNAVIALAIDPELFDGWQAAAIIGRARDELLTSRGLRSLAPREPGYRGHYEGRSEERHSSYHQGTAWTFLLGAFVRAALRLSPDDPELRAELRGYVEVALEGGPVLGQVAQLADGEPPHRYRGCPAQAWSVGELLRALIVELSL